MQATSKNKIQELQSIISKMPLELVCVAALPEFGVRWRVVAREVRNARLPMTPTSIAKILCRHVAKTLPAEEVEEIVARLRLKLVATQSRVWHVIKLIEPLTEEPVNWMTRALPMRITQALRQTKKKDVTPEVETTHMGSYVYLSSRLWSPRGEGPALLACVAPGAGAVALVSSTRANAMLKATVHGLGFNSFEDCNLHGRDVESLFRIANDHWTANADHLTTIPEYLPRPVVTKHGIDFTNHDYDKEYVENILGPNPPHLTDLVINTEKRFFDRNRLDKSIKLTVELKSEDVAKSFKAWVDKGVLAANSEFLQIFHEIKYNKFNYNSENEE